MKRRPYKTQKKIKIFEIIGFRPNRNPLMRVEQKLLEVEARSEDDAKKTGINYAKMMGVEYSHTKQKG